MAKTENAIWVVAQLENGETLGVTYELLGQARRLADTVGQNTAVILIARENNGHAEKLIAQGADVAHDVVPELLFDPGHPLEVDVFEVGPEFSDLGVGDGQPEGLFVLGQRQPQPAPGGVFVLGRPDAAHFLARIASGQRIVIGVVFAVHKSFPLIEVVGMTHTL